MSHLPVIVSFGGISPAGRSSFHYGYRRLVFDALSRDEQDRTLQNLAVLTGRLRHAEGLWVDADDRSVDLATWLKLHRQTLLDGTLIRKLENNLFEPAQILSQNPVTLEGADASGALVFTLAAKKLPAVLPENWQVLENDG